MYKFKLSRKVQIILATIFLIVTGVILSATLSNNSALAVGKCPLCGGAVKHYHQSGNTHQWVCQSDSTHHEIESCTGGSWKPSVNVDDGHAKYCVYCGYATATGKCYDDNEDGNCDVCGRTGMHTHSYTEIYYTKRDDETHNVIKECSCGDTQNAGIEEHNFGSFRDNGDGNHSATCSDCGYKKTESHRGATHANGGKCTVCKAVYETHTKSNTVKEYTKTETGHIPVYKCTHEGCTETYIGIEESHKNETYTDNGDGTHSSTCTECGEVTTENHNFENGTCTDCKSEEPDVDIESEEYEFLEGYVTNIQPHTMASTFKQNLKTNATEINIYNNENKLLKDDEIVATKMKLELKKGSKVKTFTLVVRGDVNEDGEADFKDMTKVNQVRLNKTTLEDINSIAGDVTGDNKIDFKDLVKMNRFRLNKIREL